MNKNLLDALLGLLEPWLLGLNTMGIAGVSIFFFLSSFLVWTSWARDPNVKRFFWRRSLRIFPALWVVTLASVFVLGLTITVLSAHDYFAAPSTWQYLRTVVLVSPNTLPRLFPANLLPYVVNGSLWTLPDEYLCYVTFAVVGSVIGIVKAPRRVALAGAAVGFGDRVVGARFVPHLEMVALFWWGVFYGYWRQAASGRWAVGLSVVAFLVFACFGSRGAKRAAVLACSALMAHEAMSMPNGLKWTDRLGELSYGVYIFEFPVQQLGVLWAIGRNLSFAASLLWSCVVTLLLAYASWHLVEKSALRFKPGGVPT